MQLQLFLLSAAAVLFTSGLEAEIDSFGSTKETDPNVMDFGTLRATRRNRNTYVIAGEMELKINLGNELTVTSELMTKQRKTLSKQQGKLCDFMKTDLIVWPELKKCTNFPKDDQCPLPKGKYITSDYTVDSRKIPPGILPGQYIGRVAISDETKRVIMAYEIGFTIKL